MRAKEYISYYSSSLKFAEELNSTIDRFLDYRNNYSKTSRFFTAYLSEPEKWVKFVEKCLNKKIDSHKHWGFIQELERCISSDASFSYLHGCIANKNKTEINVITSEQIDQYISNQYENYPCTCIDDYLTNSINAEFIKTIDSREYTEHEELDIFNSAYRLFDEIRQQLPKTRHATHIFKEFSMDSEQMKDDVLRLLSFYIRDYNYDVSPEQRSKLDEFANLLGIYIQRRNNQNEGKTLRQGKWTLLKETIDNMIGNKEKIALLLQEKAFFLQLPDTEREAIGNQFADNCQIEIDKINALQTLGCNDKDTNVKGDGASIKISSIIITELLRMIDKGKSSNDLTAICRLIAFLTGKSYKKIYNDVQKGYTLTDYHEKEIEQANKILSDLNINISINKDKQY